VNQFAIIVAGGSGQRMGSTTPKQFLLLDDVPVLMHSIRAFSQSTSGMEIILVLPEAHISTWDMLCSEHNFSIPHLRVAGGNTRGDSVKNGLDAIAAAKGVVAVHDGVRPLVSKEIISKGFILASKGHNAVPCTEITDSLRQITTEGSTPIDRSMIRRIQTPQCFPLNVLRKAYQSPSFRNFTDDAQLVESLGFAITLFEGSPENLKITTALDLHLASLLLHSDSESE